MRNVISENTASGVYLVADQRQKPYQTFPDFVYVLQYYTQVLVQYTTMSR